MATTDKSEIQHFHARIDPDAAWKLRELAEQTGMTQSEVLCEAVRLFFEKENNNFNLDSLGLQYLKQILDTQQLLVQKIDQNSNELRRYGQTQAELFTLAGSFEEGSEWVLRDYSGKTTQNTTKQWRRPRLNQR